MDVWGEELERDWLNHIVDPVWNVWLELLADRDY